MNKKNLIIIGVAVVLFTASGCGSESVPPELTGRLAFITTRTREIREQSVIGIWDHGTTKFIKVPDAGSAEWSPDGKMILNHIRKALTFIDAEGNVIKTIPWAPNLDVFEVRWFPDGKRILLVEQPADVLTKGKQSLSVYNLGDGTRQVLIPGIKDSDSFSGVSVSPDGNKILYSKAERLPDGKRKPSAIYLMDLNSHETQRFFDGDHPVWAPNGKSFAFDHSIHNRKGELVAMSEISIYDFGTGKRRQITHGAGWIFHLIFSPDGKSLIFSASTGEGFRLFHVNVNGGKIVKLFEDGTTFAAKPVSDSNPSWIS